MTGNSESTRNWLSARTIMEGLILAALLWMGSTSLDTQVKLGVLISQMETLKSQAAGQQPAIDSLNTRVTTNEIEIRNLKSSVEEVRAVRGAK